MTGEGGAWGLGNGHRTCVYRLVSTVVGMGGAGGLGHGHRTCVGFCRDSLAGYTRGVITVSVCVCVCVSVCVCVCVRAPLTLTLVSLYRMGRRLSRRSAVRTGLLWATELNATRATCYTL